MNQITPTYITMKLVCAGMDSILTDLEDHEIEKAEKLQDSTKNTNQEEYEKFLEINNAITKAGNDFMQMMKVIAVKAAANMNREGFIEHVKITVENASIQNMNHAKRYYISIKAKSILIRANVILHSENGIMLDGICSTFTSKKSYTKVA